MLIRQRHVIYPLSSYPYIVMHGEYNQAVNLIFKIHQSQFEALGIRRSFLSKVLIPVHLKLLTRFFDAEKLTIWYVTKLGRLGPNLFWFTYLPSIDSNMIDKLCGRSLLKFSAFYECANHSGLSQVGMLKRRLKRLSPKFLTSVRSFVCYFKKLRIQGAYSLSDELASQVRIEAKNESTNLALSCLASKPSWYAEFPNNSVYQLVKVRNILRSLLDPQSSLVDFQAKFGPGSTADGNRSVSEKLSAVADVYLAVRVFFPNSYMPLWFRVSPKLQIFFIANYTMIHFYRLFGVEIPSLGVIVPKTAVKGRFIASEPTVLGYLSMAVADYIDTSVRRRFLLGISFVSQKRNQAFAKLASTSQYYCTVDLSSASDLISKRLFVELFPPFLHDIINLLMTDSIAFNGFIIRKQRLASMGNGITFRVLALVCYCCSLASVMDTTGCSLFEADSLVSIFGDDICLPSQSYGRLAEYLTLMGLVVNNEKSFVKTRFAESCGHHYYDGLLVTPSYLRSLPFSSVACASCVDHTRVLRTRGFHESAKIWESYLRVYFIRKFKVVIPKARGDSGYISFYDDKPSIPLKKAPVRVGKVLGVSDTIIGPSANSEGYSNYVSLSLEKVDRLPVNYLNHCKLQVQAEIDSGRCKIPFLERLEQLIDDYFDSNPGRLSSRYDFEGSLPRHVWRTVLVARPVPAGEKSFDSLLYNGLRGARSDAFEYVKYKFGIRKTKMKILV